METKVNIKFVNSLAYLIFAHHRWLYDDYSLKELQEALSFLFHNAEEFQKIIKISRYAQDGQGWILNLIKENELKWSEIDAVLSSPIAADYIKKEIREALNYVEPPPRVKYKRPGSIYLGRSSHNLTKIGFSTSPKKREHGFQIADPNFKMIYISPPVFSINHEGGLHRRLETYRRRGEWFELSERQINKIMKTIESKASNL